MTRTNRFRTLKSLSAHASPRHRVIRNRFKDAYQYMKSGMLLWQVINKINESLDFNQPDGLTEGRANVVILGRTT